MAGRSSPFSSEEEFRRHVDEAYGLRKLKPEWVTEQMASRQNSLIRSICNKDIREISYGSVPWRPQDAHSVQLGVKVLVQIEEVENVAAADRKAAFPRLLQFSLTDGAVTFIAIELDATTSKFTTDTPPGTKLVLQPTALVRRGRVLLASADYTLLGSPQKSLWSGRSEAVPRTEVFAQTSEHAGARGAGSSGARRWNPATGITDIGGIADISEPVDEDADNDIRIESPTLRSLYPPPVRERTIKLPSRRINENRGMREPVHRTPSNAQLPDDANIAQARRNERNEITFEPRTTSIAARSSVTSDVRPTVSPFRNHVNGSSNQNFLPGNEKRELTFQEPPVSKEIARPCEIVVDESHEPVQELERMNISDTSSARLAGLTRLMDITASRDKTSGVCRFYAMKVAKKMECLLLREGAVSTIVDDGTSVKVIAVSNELIKTLRNNLLSRNEEYAQAAKGDVRCSLRSICGFFRMESQGKNLVATSLISKAPVSVS